MDIEIKTIVPKKIVGMRTVTSGANNTTRAMWQQFMPRRKEIAGKISDELISMQVFDDTIPFTEYTEDTGFESWATVEVTGFDDVPLGMLTHTIQEGMYAVYTHKGDFATFFKTQQYIINTWLPQNGYQADSREYFEVLGEKYKNNHPDSEEQVYIPIKPATASNE